MAGFIIKDDERKQREAQILRDFGHASATDSKEDNEKAEYIAEKVTEMKKNWRN